MSIRDDLEKVSDQVKGSIARFARKLISKHPNIHSIVLDRKDGVKEAREFTDFELTLFFNAECESETKRIVSESRYYGGSGEISKNYKIYNPGSAYRGIEKAVNADEASALFYKFTEEHRQKHPQKDDVYLEFLQEHLKFFTINDYFDITTINSPEMEKSNPLLYRLFTTGRLEKGYLVYNTLIKPFLTTQIDIMEDQI